jgi:hypothetical protein
MTKISVLVPSGATPDAAGAHRAAVWAYCSRKWARLRDLGAVDEVVVGKDPLFGQQDPVVRPTDPPVRHVRDVKRHPFSVARALNAAAEKARGDHFLLFGADHIPDMAAIAWATHQLRGYAFARIYERVAYATEAATRIILSNLAYPLEAADWHEVSAPCPGVLGVRRSAWDKAGGLDERYEGWGYEDTAFLDRLQATHHNNGLRGTMGPSGLVLRELWHDTTARDLAGRNAELYRGGPA